jgi:hypothetical protein
MPGAIGQVLQERKHLFIDPMQILEDEHWGTVLGDCSRTAEPRKLLNLNSSEAEILAWPGSW